MFRVAAIALLLTTAPAAAQQTAAERLNQLLDQIVLLPENNCRPTPAEISMVIDGVIATLPVAGRTRGSLIADPVQTGNGPADDGTATAMRALGYLVQFPNWRAENHDDAVMRLRAATGAEAGRRVQEAAGRALAFGRGGLVPLVMAHHGDAPARFDAIRDFIAAEHRAGGNPFLAAIARLTLAEGLQEEAYGQRPDSAVPWAPQPAVTSATASVDQGAQSPPQMLAEAIALYRETQGFYGELRDDPSWGGRDSTLDFDYLIALLDYVNGGGDWQPLLAQIIEVEGNKDHYQLSAGSAVPRQIFVQNFLRLPPSIVISAEASDQSTGRSMDILPTTCPPPEEVSAASAQGVDAATGLGVNRYFNAPLLAHHTCTVLERWQDGAAPALARTLAAHSNADYRIVLGHFRGDEVRFSFLSRKELMAAAEQLAGDPTLLAQYEPEPAPVATDACPWPEAAAVQFIPSLEIGDQPTGGDSGYIYLGNGLTWAQGNQLLDHVRGQRGSSAEFSGAYLIRPVIE